MIFRLAPEGFAEVRRSLKIRMAVIMPLACGGSLYIAGASWAHWATYAIMGFFGLVALSSYQRSLVRQREYWASYEIEVDDERITRRIAGYAPFVILRAEIQAAQRSRGGDLDIVAGTRRLTVPRHLVNLELLNLLVEQSMQASRAGS